jgi:hypothetical protein
MANGLTGYWVYRGLAESGMWLKTRQHGLNVRFQLELSRGAPSYNTGWIEGKFDLNNNVGVFQTVTEGGRCEITFKFSSSRVEVHQTGEPSTCLFGYNVSAEGVLRRKSLQMPEFSDGDPRFGRAK